nr:GGDEF domain-containing protein [Pseudoalteromonas sp. 2CM36K]
MISKTKINKPSWLNLINIDSVYSFDKQRQVFSFISEYFRHRSHLAIADITLEQKQHAHTDQLTGAPNRRFITSHFLKLAASRPAHYLPLSILLIDLDKFKQLNDTYGHDFGDTVLIEFTKLLESQFPATALKARYGGEEFVVILPQQTTLEASILANRFYRMCAKPCDANRQTSASIINV